MTEALPALVSTEWLATHLGQDGLRVVDGSWYLPGSGRDAVVEYAAGHLPGAVFFDLDASSDQGIVGPPDTYHLLKVGGNGQAEDDVVLAMPLPKEGAYFVNVHASAANMSTIVACGNLAPPAQ